MCKENGAENNFASYEVHGILKSKIVVFCPNSIPTPSSISEEEIRIYPIFVVVLLSYPIWKEISLT
jgi:hypothetical protein